MQKIALLTYSPNHYPQRVMATICQHPFGMLMPGRIYSSEAYGYGFNGKEKDDEVSGGGNNLDFGARVYDSRLGRWMSVDPLRSKYPGLSPYNFAINNPTIIIDIDGRDVIQSNKFAAHPVLAPALVLFNSTEIANTFLLQFAKKEQTVVAGYSNVDMTLAKDGILSNHNVSFNTETESPGETRLKIKVGDKYVDYTGQELDNNVQFEISIGITASKFDSKAGTAYVMGHEAFVHAEVIAKALEKFEKAKADANDDPTKIKEALTILKEDLKGFDSSPKNSKVMNKSTGEQHESVADWTNASLMKFFTQLSVLIKEDKKETKSLNETKDLDIKNQLDDVDVKAIKKSKK